MQFELLFVNRRAKKKILSDRMNIDKSFEGFLVDKMPWKELY